jgi:beta-phosphoglucomutase-like phosphatase (HAD superfamily)
VSDTGPVVTLSPRDYDVVLFDLDGVLTRTARVLAAAGKELFDAFVAQRFAETGEPLAPFERDADYRRDGDGKTRQNGVTALPEPRGRGPTRLGLKDDVYECAGGSRRVFGIR